MTDNSHNHSLIESLFKVGAHFGLVRSRRHPSVRPYIFGVKNKIEIFDLEKTSSLLNDAKDFARKIGEEGGMMLFVGGKNEARQAIQNVAQSIEMPYVAGRWIGGTLTNFPEIRRRVTKLEDLTSQREKGELGKYTKKERLLIDREIEQLDASFSGLANLKSQPKALFVIDSRREHIAVNEAKRMGVPVIALVSSDGNLRDIDYPIPGNDASQQSIEFFVNEIANSFKEGRKEFLSKPAPKQTPEQA